MAIKIAKQQYSIQMRLVWLITFMLCACQTPPQYRRTFLDATSPQYRRTFLDAMLPAELSRANALSISDAGTIVGYAYNAQNEKHAVVWERILSEWAITDLGASCAAGQFSEAVAVNDSQEIVGYISACSTCPRTGIHWKKQVATHAGGWTMVQAEADRWDNIVDINNQSELVGSVQGEIPLAFRRSYDPRRNGYLCGVGADTTVVGLNDSSDVLINFKGLTHGVFVYPRKEPSLPVGCVGGTVLPKPGNSRTVHGSQINQRGDVVGHVTYRTNPLKEAHLWSRSDETTWTGVSIQCDFATCYGNYTESEALGLNDRGQIVGYHGNGSKRWATVWSKLRTFSLWGPDFNLRLLNDLSYAPPPPPSPDRPPPPNPPGSWHFSQANAVNSAGAIVGTGTFDGGEGAFLVEPLEPYSIQAVPMYPTGVNNFNDVIGVDLTSLPKYHGGAKFVSMAEQAHPTLDTVFTNGPTRLLGISDHWVAGCLAPDSVIQRGAVAPLFGGLMFIAPLATSSGWIAEHGGGVSNSYLAVGNAKLGAMHKGVAWNIMTSPNFVAGESFSQAEIIRPASGAHIPLIMTATCNPPSDTFFRDVNDSQVIAVTCNEPPMSTAALVWSERFAQAANCDTTCGTDDGCYLRCGSVLISATNGEARAINSANQVVGYIHQPNQQERGFVYRWGEGVRFVGSIDVGMTAATTLNDINSRGEVVGAGWANTIGPPPIRSALISSHHPYGSQALSSMLTIEDASHWQLTEATGINDRGTIVGIGGYSETGGEFLKTGFVLTRDATVQTHPVLIPDASCN